MKALKLITASLLLLSSQAILAGTISSEKRELIDTMMTLQNSMADEFFSSPQCKI